MIPISRQDGKPFRLIDYFSSLLVVVLVDQFQTEYLRVFFQKEVEMQHDPIMLKLLQIYLPDRTERRVNAILKQQRFAYYTRADTALKIFKNEELWLRNATVMNDFSEIRYGIDLMSNAYESRVGEYFRYTVDSIFEGTVEPVTKNFEANLNSWQVETYLACISEHDESEDQSGRLSMWRAYGDTAIVVNNKPMAAITDKLGVFSTPILYLTQSEYNTHLEMVTDSIREHKDFILEQGQTMLINFIHEMQFQTAIGTKHPGFKEEREWRIFHRPKEKSNPNVKHRIEVISGIPQKIYVLKLGHDPENGLYGADIPTLLDRVIVGPTMYPYVTASAFAYALEESKVSDPWSKVKISDIPLRTR